MASLPPAARRRRYVLLGGAVALTGALAYKAYSSDALGRGRSSLERLRAVLRKYVDALSTGADVASGLLRDLQLYLQSDSDVLPPSLRQLARLLQSQEATATAAAAASAIYQGLSGGQGKRSPVFKALKPGPSRRTGL